jgi:thiamine biosynthesis protein ThiS
MLVTEPAPGLPWTVAAAVRGGVDIVQWRVKGVPALPEAMAPADLAGLLTLAGRMWVASSGALLVVNGPAWLADAAKADGRHRPEGGEDPGGWPVATHPLPGSTEGQEAVVGCSVHSVAGATAAARRADYLVAGAVFETESHPGQAPAGPEMLRAVCAAVHVPVLAIGGITPERIQTCLDAGASGVAVLSGLTRAADPGEAAAEYRRALGHSVETRGMNLIVNGETRAALDGVTIEAYLRSLSLKSQLVVVEHNGDIVARDRYADTVLHEGDTLEIVQMMAGG